MIMFEVKWMASLPNPQWPSRHAGRGTELDNCERRRNISAFMISPKFKSHSLPSQFLDDQDFILANISRQTYLCATNNVQVVILI